MAQQTLADQHNNEIGLDSLKFQQDFAGTPPTPPFACVPSTR
jgi:hypothetical protein